MVNGSNFVNVIDLIIMYSYLSPSRMYSSSRRSQARGMAGPMGYHEIYINFSVVLGIAIYTVVDRTIDCAIVSLSDDVLWVQICIIFTDVHVMYFLTKKC